MLVKANRDDTEYKQRGREPRGTVSKGTGPAPEDIASQCAPRERFPWVEKMKVLRQKIGMSLTDWWGKGRKGRHTVN